VFICQARAVELSTTRAVPMQVSTVARCGFFSLKFLDLEVSIFNILNSLRVL
jgi:hypothetical protein